MKNSRDYRIGEQVKVGNRKGIILNYCWDSNNNDWLYDVVWDDGEESDIYQEFLPVR